MEIPAETISRLLDALDNLATHIIVLDEHWRYAYANKPALKRLNKDLDELIGKSIWELYPYLLGTPFERAARKTVRDHQVREVEDYYRSTDRWYLSRLVPAGDGIMLQIFDVTKTKKTENTNKMLINALDQALDTPPVRKSAT